MDGETLAVVETRCAYLGPGMIPNPLLVDAPVWTVAIVRSPAKWTRGYLVKAISSAGSRLEDRETHSLRKARDAADLLAQVLGGFIKDGLLVVRLSDGDVVPAAGLWRSHARRVGDNSP